ncbi:unnamed protein product [Schistosoma curassoni]|uniref:Amino_oxidase domain-containing protein n=1 Tax=Schistosoma curassoni TaxID=6186 RepID=A0A183K3F6_9TREM|nr:unnamed protein product [Schistosoma curassoni]
MYEFIIKQPTKHNHVPYKSTTDAKKTINIMKDRTAFSTDAAHQIVVTVSTGLSYVVSAQSPADSVMKQHDSQASFLNPAVVGGGIGGASSAYFLRKMFGNKVSITLFEKSGRIGGRIKAVPFCGETCESGASAIHSSNHYMTSFANQFKIPLVPLKNADHRLLLFEEGYRPVFSNITDQTTFLTPIHLFWRYGLNLLRAKFYLMARIREFTQLTPLNPPHIEAAPTNLPMGFISSTVEGMRMAIGQMKNGKAAGPDNKPADTLTSDMEVTAKVFHMLFRRIWEKKQVPLTDWKEGYFMKVQKKADLSKIYALQERGECFTSPGLLLKKLSKHFPEMTKCTFAEWMRKEIGLDEKYINELGFGIFSSNYCQNSVDAHAFVGELM